jgi:hypothetical protein
LSQMVKQTLDSCQTDVPLLVLNLGQSTRSDALRSVINHATSNQVAT